MAMELEKSLLDSTNEDIHMESEFLRQWLSIDWTLRKKIRKFLFREFGGSPSREVSFKASQLIAKLASIDAFGQVFEEIVVQDEVSLIITAIEYGMKQATKVRLIAEAVLGNVLQHFVISPENFLRIARILMESIEDRERFDVFEAIFNLAQWVENCRPASDNFAENIFYILYPLWPHLRQSSKLRSSVYKAMSEAILSFNPDRRFLVILKIFFEIDEMLNDKNISEGCTPEFGVVVAIVQNQSTAESELVRGHFLQCMVPRIVWTFRIILDRCRALYKDVIYVLGEVAVAIGPLFGEYMGFLYEDFESGLQNLDDLEAYHMAVSIVGDIGRVLGDELAPYWDRIMIQLLKNMNSPKLDVTARPLTFACIYQIAFAMNENFAVYADQALALMQQDAVCCHWMDEEEKLKFGDRLMFNLFRAYDKNFQGLRHYNRGLLELSADHLMSLISVIAEEPRRKSSITMAALLALGSVVDPVGMDAAYIDFVKGLLEKHPFYEKLLQACLLSEDEGLMETAGWAQGLIGNVFG